MPTAADLVAEMDRHRKFPENTCPSSRHVQMIAEALATEGCYGMIEDDPMHVASSLSTVVSSLYQTRSFLMDLGYTWQSDGAGGFEWVKKDG
jgi:hypothetical protein